MPVIVMVACNLASCNSASNNAAAPVPESGQVVSADLKKLYMAAAAAVPQSPAQQKIILQMARDASSGKDLLLVMRAAVGAFPSGTGAESRVHSIVTDKMIRVGTLNQLIECATQYTVDPAFARPFADRMFQLGDGSPDPRVWYRIKVAASHLKLGDLEREAQARGDQLARR